MKDFVFLYLDNIQSFVLDSYDWEYKSICMNKHLNALSDNKKEGIGGNLDLPQELNLNSNPEVDYV